MSARRPGWHSLHFHLRVRSAGSVCALPAHRVISSARRRQDASRRVAFGVALVENSLESDSDHSGDLVWVRGPLIPLVLTNAACIAWAACRALLTQLNAV